MFLSSQFFNNLWNEATFKASFMPLFLVLLPLWTKASIHIANQL